MKSIWNKGKKLLLELFIVFLGVYLAFQLNNYKENIALNKLKNNYYTLILSEFQANLREISYAENGIKDYLNKLKSDIVEKETPKIKSLKSIDLENNMLVLKSAFENGYLENINPKYISNLSIGSNSLTRVSKLIDKYNYSIDNVLKENNWNKELFYNEDKELKDEYKWIIDDLEFIQEYLKQLKNAFENGAIPETKKLIETK